MGRPCAPHAAFVITGGGLYCEPGPDTSLHICQRSPQGRPLVLVGYAGAKGRGVVTHIPRTLRACEFSETASPWVRHS